jgi:hypothetical protein
MRKHRRWPVLPGPWIKCARAVVFNMDDAMKRGFVRRIKPDD